MEENNDIQFQLKKIPTFTVLKNGSILKNIFLLHKQSAADKSSQNRESDEETLLVGRHPHCHITLGHPSISRHHLRIHSNPSSHMLSVVDLSSVHGTWVSGRRIEPGVHVTLEEGDTVKIGGSSRVYELHWVPLSQAYEVDEQFVPAVYTIKGGGEEEEDGKHEGYSSDDDLECLELSASNTIHDSPLKTSNPLTFVNENDDVFASVSTQASLVSETTSATWVSDSLNEAEDQLITNCSTSSSDDTEVEQSPFLANGNGVASEAISETEMSDCLNKSEDKWNWLRDNLSNEFDQISHGTIKDDLVSIDLSNAIETHEKDGLNQNIAISNEPDTDNENQQKINNGSDENRDVGCEFEEMNQMKVMDESASMVLYDGVDMGVKFDSIDHEIMKEESSFVVLSDVSDVDDDQTFTPDISEAKEIYMNLSSAQKLSASIKLFHSLDGKEVEFYTPDKENKNPNACSRKSWSKKLVNPVVYEEKDIFSFSQNLFARDEGMYREQEVDPFVNCEEVLAISSEKESKSIQVKMEGSCNSINYPQTVQKVVSSSQTLTKKRWTMVVDTSSLLDHKSLKHLKLLEGIKGTRLFVPKIVIRELVDIKSQDNFFNRSSKKASLALKWIAECMLKTRWWIHMHDDNVHSSSAVSEVLKTGLHLRKEIRDQKIIILSDNLTLKIKAMAEGIMCEAAKEFHESLVNPFSERFMWVGSSARGLTWSCVDDDDDIVRRKYHGFGLNRSHRFEGLKLLARATSSQLVS